MNRDVAQIGFWSAMLVAICVAAFGLLLLVGSWISTIMPAFLICLLLAPAFVAMIVAIHEQAPADKKIWSRMGVAAAVVYAVMISITYYIQLTVVRLNSRPALPEALRPFQYTPGTVFFALDILGYGFMALATLVTAPVFGGDGLSVWIRRWFLLQGLFVPGVIAPALPIFDGSAGGSGDMTGALVLIGWSVLFLPLPIMVARYFRRALHG